MKYVLFIFLIFLGKLGALAQGSWDIGYIEVDSITFSDIGKLVKIDFRHNLSPDKKSIPKGIRDFLSPQDTLTLIYDSQELTFIEKRKIYVDHGSYNDQFLELKNKNLSFNSRIYNSKLLKIEDNKFMFEITIEAESKSNLSTINLWIDKKYLDGVMIQI